MTPRFRLTELAEADVMDIWFYIAFDNVEAADRLVDHFTETFKHLAENPRIGSKQDHYRSGLRAFPVGSYIIFYRMIENGIECYRVLHGARQFEELL